MSNYGNHSIESGRSNKLVYFLVFIIVLLLVAAVAIVFYFSSQMMEMKKEVAVVRQSATQAQPVLAPTEPPTPAPAKAAPAKLATEDIATIVQVVMSQMQKNQKTSAPSVSVQPTPPPKQASAPTPRAPATDSTDDLESMIDVLGSVDADTVEEKPLSIAPDKEKALMKTKAGRAPQKAKDNFNKVVVTDNGADDFSQLGNEVDQLVEAGGAEESGYEKKMKQEVVERQNEMRTIVVREGDTLTSLARKAYGDGRKYAKILRANPGIIKNPDRIFVGQVLRVPN